MLFLPWLMLASGLVTFALFFLFHAEENQGRRLLLIKERARLDHSVLFGYQHLTQLAKHFGTGSLRILLHYVAHQILGIVLWMARFVEARVANLRQRNKIIAKAAQDRDKNHLDHIAEHKLSTSLSETEKIRLKEKSLEE